MRFSSEKNIKLNQIEKKVEVINAAVYYKKSKINMVEEQALNLSYVSEYTGDYSVNTYTLEELFNIYQPYLVKIDIEGFEYELFFKSKNFEYLPPYLFIEIHFDKKIIKRI